MTTWILTFLLFFLPLVVFPFGTSPFEIPKVIAAELGIIILIVLTFLEEETSAWKSISQRQLLLAGIIVILSVVHLIFLRTSTTLMGNQFRLQGVYLLWLLLLFSMLAGRLPARNIPKWVNWMSTVAVFGSIFIFGVDETGRAVGSLGKPNTLAAAGIFLWPWLFLGNKGTYVNRGQKFASLVFIGLIVFLSGSRSGFVAFTIQMVAIGLRQLLKWPIKRVVMVCFSLLGLSLLLPLIERGGVLENRVEVWQTAIQAGLEQPVFGHGFGNIEHALRSSAFNMSNNIRYQYVDSTHNLFLDWWVQGGVIGLSLLVLFIAYSLNNFIAQDQMLYITLLLGLLTVMSFNPVSVVTLVAFWWVIGQEFVANFLRQDLPLKDDKSSSKINSFISQVS